MAITTRTVAPGDDLYRVAAEVYGNSSAWTLIARANGLIDPLIQVDAVLSIPAYNANQVNDGILASE
jgi:nucleoid-associated protein YgaU